MVPSFWHQAPPSGCLCQLTLVFGDIDCSGLLPLGPSWTVLDRHPQFTVHKSSLCRPWNPCHRLSTTVSADSEPTVIMDFAPSILQGVCTAWKQEKSSPVQNATRDRRRLLAVRLDMAFTRCTQVGVRTTFTLAGNFTFNELSFVTLVKSLPLESEGS